ncbi:MAG TPA: peptidoglycan editing factor PgeF [Marmoricola sp.]|nr:peptidoglycan editing factor PgeF [Marmoricola sp.]
MYSYRATLGPADLAFTDRRGGVSAAPFDSLDLALEGDDDPAARAENLRRVLADFGPGDELVDLRQVHGADVVVAEAGEAGSRSVPGRPEADAVVTARPGITLMVRAADCVPVLLVDPAAAVVAAVHSGRQGLLAGVVPAAVARMREIGATGPITAWVGPHVCGACYEVPAGMQAEVGRAVPAAVATTSWGTPALDLGAGVREQLLASGVEVVDAARCTRESPDLYSYRRDGARAGRHAGLVRIRR